MKSVTVEELDVRRGLAVEAQTLYPNIEEAELDAQKAKGALEPEFIRG